MNALPHGELCSRDQSGGEPRLLQGNAPSPSWGFPVIDRHSHHGIYDTERVPLLVIERTREGEVLVLRGSDGDQHGLLAARDAANAAFPKAGNTFDFPSILLQDLLPDLEETATEIDFLGVLTFVIGFLQVSLILLLGILWRPPISSISPESINLLIRRQRFCDRERWMLTSLPDCPAATLIRTGSRCFGRVRGCFRPCREAGSRCKN